MDSKYSEALDDADEGWVENNTQWAIEVADCIHTETEKTEKSEASRLFDTKSAHVYPFHSRVSHNLIAREGGC